MCLLRGTSRPLKCNSGQFSSLTFTNLTILLIKWLGRYVRVVDHLAVGNVAQGAPLGGGSTWILGGQDKNDGELTLFLLCYYPL